MQTLPPVSVRWLVAANVVWLAAGLLAYWTTMPMMLGAALAAAVALPGLLILRASGDDLTRLWMDRAVSASVGTLVLLLVLAALPLMTLEDGGELWTTRGYWVLTLLVANGGFLLMNAAALLGAGAKDAKTDVRTYTIFHVGLLVVALYFLLQVDDAMTVYSIGSREMAAFDLRMAPVLAAVPGVTWALGFWRLGPSASAQAAESA